jgi:cbb3-type cytochrome oxidase subunit 3
MLENYFKLAENVQIFSITATVIFFVVFIAVVIWVFRIDKKYINKMENLPFDK